MDHAAAADSTRPTGVGALPPRCRREAGARHAAGVALALGALAWLDAGAAHAQAEWGFSPGVTIAWSRAQGVTYGFEVSFVRLPDLQDVSSGGLLDRVTDVAGRAITRTYGIVFQVATDFDGFRATHLGVEWVGPFLGLDVGPTLVRLPTGRRYGTTLSPWFGYTLYGYYAHTFVVRGDDLSVGGLMLKTPLLGFGQSTSDLDFDDD